MQIYVLLKMVPDVVEELTIDKDGKSLDEDSIRFKASESDEHALEEAILLKEKYGGTVTAAALDAPDIDDLLYLALAKGANRAVKISASCNGWQTSSVANLFSSFLSSQSTPLTNETIILTGSQAIDDIEGEVGAYLSDILKLPYISIVTGINVDGATKSITVIKEFSGGLRGELTVQAPAVIGIQSASKLPRYVPISKINAVRKSTKIETATITASESKNNVLLRKMLFPTSSGKAEMFEGSLEDISTRLAETLSQHGIL